MGSVSVFLIGGNSFESVLEASGTYWHISLLGGGKIDLRKAVFPAGEPVRINIITVFGGSQILAPKGTRAEISGLQLIGGNRSRVRPAEQEVRNHLKVKVFCVAGGTNVSSEEEAD